MIAGLFLAGVIMTALTVSGIWFMSQAATIPAARGTGRAPDESEEAEARVSAEPAAVTDSRITAPQL